MNTPRLSSLRNTAALLLLSAAVVSPASLFARLGETQSSFEKRLLQPGLGKLYHRPQADTSRDKPRKARTKDDDPLKDVRAFMPPEAHEVLYWKSAVADQLSNETGWIVDVFYVGGQSVLEAYKRVGDSLSDFEVRGLLALNRGSHSWKKIDAPPGGGDGDAASTSGIPYDYELEDGSLRARQKGDWLVIFATKVDNYVVQQQAAAKATADLQREQQRREQALKAPESVAGF